MSEVNKKECQQIVNYLVANHRASDGSRISAQHAVEVWAMMPAESKWSIVQSFSPAENRFWETPGDSYTEKDENVARKQLRKAQAEKTRLVRRMKKHRPSQQEVAKKHALEKLLLKTEMALLVILKNKGLKYNQYRSGKTNDDVSMVGIEIDNLQVKIDRARKEIDDRDRTKTEAKSNQQEDQGQTIIQKEMITIGKALKIDPLTAAFQGCAKVVAEKWNTKRKQLILNIVHRKNPTTNDKLLQLQQWCQQSSVHKNDSGIIFEQAERFGIQTSISISNILGGLVHDIHLIPAAQEAVSVLQTYYNDYPKRLVDYYCGLFEKMRYLQKEGG